MKLHLALLLCAACGATLAADPRTSGTVLFEDHFDRTETKPDKDDVGNGWTTNSAGRAKGHKQVTLADGAMHVIKHAEADHAVAIVHAAEFQNGAVELRFKIGIGDDLNVGFLDRELKTVHSGHLASAKVTMKGIVLTDQKTGGMNNEIREQRIKPGRSPEITALLKTKTKTFPLALKADDWHTLLITIQGDVMHVEIDGNIAGELESEGIAHPTKRMFSLGVNKTAWVDDVKVWKL